MVVYHFSALPMSKSSLTLLWPFDVTPALASILPVACGKGWGGGQPRQDVWAKDPNQSHVINNLERDPSKVAMLANCCQLAFVNPSLHLRIAFPPGFYTLMCCFSTNGLNSELGCEATSVAFFFVSEKQIVILENLFQAVSLWFCIYVQRHLAGDFCKPVQ